MDPAFLVSDLHGSESKYTRLLNQIEIQKPEVVFIAGDILPSGIQLFSSGGADESFITSFMIPAFNRLRDAMKEYYPKIYIILGNDDARIEEEEIKSKDASDCWHYINNSFDTYKDYKIFGYCFVPPSPFRLKDWEKYDVSRYVDPGCVSPEEGIRTQPVRKLEIRNSTIQKDLEKLTSGHDLSKSIFLFHSPPHKTSLDRANLDGKIIDHLQVDVHVGSIAIKRFIEEEQPYITIHGHVHESSRKTGKWHEKIGNTHCYNAAYEGSELAIIRLSLKNPETAERILI
jgi:Icc-related predicted phosphoesterase